MSNITRRYYLKRKEKRKLFKNISKILEIDADNIYNIKSQIEAVETRKHVIFIIAGSPHFARSEECFFPTLYFQSIISLFPKVIVDMGAVPYVCNGADLMSPGIVKVEGTFNDEKLVIVLDEKNRKPIAIAKALFNSYALKTIVSGRIFKNLHYISDDIWNFIKNY
jgi:PUA domain protein